MLMFIHRTADELIRPKLIKHWKKHIYSANSSQLSCYCSFFAFGRRILNLTGDYGISIYWIHYNSTSFWYLLYCSIYQTKGYIFTISIKWIYQMYHYLHHQHKVDLSNVQLDTGWIQQKPITCSHPETNCIAVNVKVKASSIHYKLC